MMTTAEITSWDVGDEIALTFGYFVDDVPTDVDTLALTIYSPDRSTTITKTLSDVQRLSAGSYLYGWQTAGVVPGTWEAVWSANAGGTHPVVERASLYLWAVP